MTGGQYILLWTGQPESAISRPSIGDSVRPSSPMGIAVTWFVLARVSAHTIGARASSGDCLTAEAPAPNTQRYCDVTGAAPEGTDRNNYCPIGPGRWLRSGHSGPVVFRSRLAAVGGGCSSRPVRPVGSNGRSSSSPSSCTTYDV